MPSLDVLLEHLACPVHEYTKISWDLLRTLPREQLDEAMMALTPWWSWLDPMFLATSDVHTCVQLLLLCFYMDYSYVRGPYATPVQSILEQGFSVKL